MKRPSHYLLWFALLFVAVFATAEFLQVEEAKRDSGSPAGPVSLRSSLPPPVPPRVAIRGRVLDPRGFLVVGAEIVASSGERSRTDADGAFALEVAPAPAWEVMVGARDFRTQIRRLFPNGGDPVFVALEPRAPWDPPAAAPAPPAPAPLVGEGFVRDADGKPIVGALVAVISNGVSACTDDIGRYQIPLPGPGAELVVSQDRSPESAGLCCRSEPLSLARTSGLVPLPDLVAHGGALIRGTTRDPRGQPVAGVPLLLRGQGILRSIESGRDGVFRIAGLMAGSYELVALAWRGAFGCVQKIEVGAAVVDCDVQLAAAEQQRLQVVSEAGQPLPHAYVATTVAGMRRGVGRANDQGWVEVPGAPGATAYEVRDDGLRELAIRSAGATDRLVVALP